MNNSRSIIANWRTWFKKTPDLSDRFCTHPFTKLYVERYPWSQATVCCAAWLPTEIGDLTKKSPNEVWNSDAAQDIRKSIHDGSFSHCDKNRCPWIISGKLPTKASITDPALRAIIDSKLTVLPNGPTELMLSNDRSCNLSCPSCRTEKILIKEGPEFDEMNRLHHRLLDDTLEGLDRMTVTGSGDPFASKIYREMLTSIEGHQHPDLKITIVTNGQLLTPRMWDKLSKIHKNIDRIFISVDAATPETYRVVRRGGELAPLIENIRHLAALRREGRLQHLQLDFVVQKLNYKEMPEFIRLGRALGVDVCNFQKIVDWQTYTAEEFKSHAIYLKDHPERRAFLALLKDPIFADRIVQLGNLAEFAPDQSKWNRLSLPLWKRVLLSLPFAAYPKRTLNELPSQT